MSCDYCLKTRSFRKGDLEGILVCKDCNAKGKAKKVGSVGLTPVA